MTVKERKQLIKDTIQNAKNIREMEAKVTNPKVKVSIAEGNAIFKYLLASKELLGRQSDLIDATSSDGSMNESSEIWKKYIWCEDESDEGSTEAPVGTSEN